MKAILEFNLPDDKWEYDLCYKAYDYYSIIEEFNETLIQWDKSGITKTQEEIRETFCRILSDFNFSDI